MNIMIKLSFARREYLWRMGAYLEILRGGSYAAVTLLQNQTFFIENVK